MPTRNITRRSTPIGAATGDAAPIYVDSDDNILKIIPAGSGTTEVQIVDETSTQTISGNKTFTGTVVMSGAVTKTEFADGTAALPSITFSDDLNTGIYRIGADNFGLSAGGAVVLDVAATAISPGVTDTQALGTTALMWSDLFLASGGVINFNNGNVTLTHAAGKLTMNGVLDLSTGTSGAATAALIAGAGTSTTACTTATADKNFIGFWTQSTATTGDSRGMYLRHYLGAAGSGEALRAFGTATAANVATGGTANGAHISFSLSGASASISGQANAARITLGADAQTRTINGNMAALMVESDIATGNTVPASVAFIRVVDTSNVRIGALLRMPNVSNGTIFAAHTTQVLTHSIKFVTDDGTAYYLMCTDAATNRS